MLADMLSQWRLWYYATIGFLIQAVLAGCIFFVPLIIDSMFTGELLKADVLLTLLAAFTTQKLECLEVKTKLSLCNCRAVNHTQKSLLAIVTALVGSTIP